MWNIAMMAQAKAASSDQDSKTEVPVDPKQAIKDDARDDVKRVKEAFETKGAQEAWDVLKKERENTKTSSMSKEDKDAWEKSVSELLTKSNNTMLLPSLSIAYLNENKDAFSKDGYINKEKVAAKQHEINHDLTLEKGFEKDMGIDDVDAVLANGAQDSIQKGMFNYANAVEEFNRKTRWDGGLFAHKRDDDEEAVRTDYLEGTLEQMSKLGKDEVTFRTNREFNKSIADRLTANEKMFNTLDESNGSFKGDGKITFNEVDKFLERVNTSSTYKGQFTAEEIQLATDLQKTLKDKNTYGDPKGTLAKVEGKFDPALLPLMFAGMLPIKYVPGITKESIAKTHNTELPKDDASIEITSVPKPVAAAEVKPTETKDNKDKADETTNADKVTAEKEKTVDNKTATTDKDKEAKKETEKPADLYSGDYENQLVNDGTQKVGEGPWQVASRLLKGKNDPAAQKALTEILKQQLIEDTKSKDYKEAVTKLEVGHTFLTCEGLNHLREKAKESGNETLIKLFGEPKMQAAANAVTNYRSGWA